MLIRHALGYALILGGLIAAPVQATCTLPRDTPLPNVQIELTSPGGQTQTRVTGADGKLSLKRLRKGVWQVRLSGQLSPVIMQVAKDRKLIIQSVTTSYSCSAPGGPVHHTNRPSLLQLNKPKKPQS